jgi:hypothetical protein
MTEIALKYLPKRLTQKDRKKQAAMLRKSRKQYREGKYYTRKRVASYKSKPSKHVTKARRIYGVDSIAPSEELAEATGCSIDAMTQIVKKGEGAYFSSGSRPNQTGQSWGIARLASAITGGKAAAVDYAILEKGCDHHKRAFVMANQSRKKHGYGKRRVAKTVL